MVKSFSTQTQKDEAIVVAKQLVADTTGAAHEEAKKALAETKDAELTG